MNKGEVFNPKPRFEFLEIKSLRRICVDVLKRPPLFFFTVFEKVKEECDSVHFYILRCARLVCCSSSDKFSSASYERSICCCKVLVSPLRANHISKTAQWEGELFKSSHRDILWNIRITSPPFPIAIKPPKPLRMLLMSERVARIRP